MKTKKCIVCKEVKQVGGVNTGFYTHPHSDDMYMPACRKCCGCTWDTPEDRMPPKEEETE